MGKSFPLCPGDVENPNDAAPAAARSKGIGASVASGSIADRCRKTSGPWVLEIRLLWSNDYSNSVRRIEVLARHRVNLLSRDALDLADVFIEALREPQ